MKKMTLWVKTTAEGRIVYSGATKEMLENFKLDYYDGPLYDVELKGEIPNEED
jgi:hypothetical protein